MYECFRRVFLSGFVVLVANGPKAKPVRSALGACLALFFVEATRNYDAFHEASSNALAYACAWQNFFTYLAAFCLIVK